MENRLWYRTASTEWIEGLPIGNGRLAAMIWGDEASDRISLNHEWLWRGVHRDRVSAPASDRLAAIRDELRAGRFFEATALANLAFGGYGGISRIPHRVDAYQPAGDLSFTLAGDPTFQGRSLDLDTAVVRTERSVASAAVVGEFIAHPGVGTILCRWRAKSGRFSGELRYARPEDQGAVEACRYEPQAIRYSCSFNGGISFAVQVDVRTDGRATPGTDRLTIDGATELVVSVNIGTSVKGIDEELGSYQMPDTPWDDLLADHQRRFSELLGRLSLAVELPEHPLPTDERITKVRAGEEDPALPLLYFHYGRYLLASSSLCGELPANLQGKWNDRIDPPWECDYHFDINIQMNYWMTEAANMPECAEALIRYVERFVPHAKRAARDLYGCRGVWLPITSDAWGRATPEAHGWAAWVGSAAWMAQHLWWHYEYGGDRDYLERRAYPFFREVALFYEDYLVEDEHGVLQIMPSQSPENRFAGTGYWPVSIGISSAMDVQLAYDAFGYAIRAARLLDTDADQAERWASLQAKLPPFRIGSDGRLLEWDIEREEVEPGHRHLSHLYGLHPSDLFNPVERPEEWQAAIRSLEHRLAQGGGHTGWSRAWVACMFARIGRGEEVWKHLYALLTDFATVTLLDLHPPRIFQIEGNLGAVEAVLQCLVQYWAGRVHLLHALPSAWPAGRLGGVKVPGGHSLAITWNEAKLTDVAITIGYSGRIVLAGLAGVLRPSGEQPAHCSWEALAGDLVVTGDPGAVFRCERV